ncbi:hypothetical protein G7046_g7842 [Stylonectria norvegica]|nr:hypothetical protein G7046_g7842 [Stylonectria norvegica]
MISYIVALIAALIFLVNPIVQMLSPRSTQDHFASRPLLNESLLAIDSPNATAPECRPDTYGVRILNKNPLVVYLEGFLSAEERGHLLEISERCPT